MSGEYESLNETVNQLRAEFEKMRRLLDDAEPRRPDLCPHCSGDLSLVEVGEHQCGNLAKIGRKER